MIHQLGMKNISIRNFWIMLIFLIFFTETTEPNEFKFGLDMPWVVPYPTAPSSIQDDYHHKK